MKKNIVTALISGAIILILYVISLSFVSFMEVRNTRSEGVNKIVKFSPDSDRKKLLDMNKKIASDSTFTKTERDSAALYYARNITDLTSVGMSEDRHKSFVDAYVSLYELSKTGATPEIQAKALLSYSYLYLESCSIDEWLHEAFSVLEPSIFKEIVKKSENNKEEISARILVNVLTKSNNIFKDKSTVVNLAENELFIARNSRTKIPEAEYLSLIGNITSSLDSVRNVASTLDDAPFNVMSTDRKMLGVYLYLTSRKTKLADIDIDVDKEFNRQIAKTLEMRSESRLGSYTNENNLRYGYANYLYTVDKIKNFEKIKAVLSPSFTEDNERNSDGWMYGLSISEDKSRYAFLKELSKTYPELRAFLKKHGWKTV